MPLKRYEPDEMLRWDWCGKSEQIESKAIEGKRERSDWAGKAYAERPGHFENDTRASNGDKSESARTGLILPCGVIKPEHVDLYHQNTEYRGYFQAVLCLADDHLKADAMRRTLQ